MSKTCVRRLDSMPGYGSNPFTLPDDCVYIGAGSKWHFPAYAGRHVDDAYKAALVATPKLAKAVRELAGKTLVCDCRSAPKWCHGKVLACVADGLANEKTKAVKRWLGTIPTECQICHQPLADAFVDGRMALGPWACMCPACHERHGVGLGVGKGQLYRLPDGIKLEG